MVISLDPDNPEVWYLIDAVEILRKGGVAVFPTDTVYGLGCDLSKKKSIERLYQIKKMPRRKPLSFICSDLKDIAKYAHVSNMAYRLMKRLLPGPYTFILPATHKVPRLMLTNRRTVGIRVPDNKICIELVQQLGNPIISTSLILDEDEPISDPFEIFDTYGNQIDLVIDGGVLRAERSTVVDLTNNSPEIIREGKGDISGII
ncbi:MAG: threonylcarbamoyl-AMP synthase [Candidatus Eremiobacteraeota bacterium]|nr:threonylcarbamoyl-AMP synthase [Candidatus Eremiobacteraeota bacterium]